jgi:hypothetical protein
MPIPTCDEHGCLSVGIRDCTLDELKARFGSFQGSDRRPQLFARLNTFVTEAKASRLVRWLIVDGSFVTAKPDPNDIDLILVIAPGHDFAADLSPAEYNVLSKQHVHRRFGFDLLVAREGSIEHDCWSEFFQQVRLESGRRKGILRLSL